MGPTERQMNCIRIIEDNLPEIRFRGTTAMEATDFIAKYKSQSECVARRRLVQRSTPSGRVQIHSDHIRIYV